MKNYLLQIVGMAILTSAFALLSPEKKMRKPIGGVLKLCMLTVLFSPVFLFFSENDSLFSPTAAVCTDEAYLTYSGERAIETYAKERYGVTVRVEFSGNFLSVYILDFGMIGESEHINIQNGLESGIRQLYADKEVRVYDQSD